jgi:chromatin modification-related protein VID21
MEPSAEIPQPVSHMDHMMAEMKWMRKDFRAERKMKTNICAWLARRCAEWVAADEHERRELQVKVKVPQAKERNDEVEMTEDSVEPDLERSGESAPEDDMGPPTPKNEAVLPTSLVVPPDLSDAVSELQKSGKLHKALEALPKAGFTEAKAKPQPAPLVAAQGNKPKREVSKVSKFADGKVLPKIQVHGQKRSRFDYEDETERLEDEPSSKRAALERDLAPEDQEIALFHPDNKPIRDRLHANNAFRPPSEHAMPTTSFYEFRSGSQWIWEDDQKLRKLAKEYSFNWSLIADELQLPPLFKSSAERRTPWECFERWVELEQLPAEMRKTMYFKTWFQRLEQSQQKAEDRYQRQVAVLQQQSGGNAQHVPLRRRTMPTRVDKRRNSRYLWLVDAMRKGARKKEQAAFKQAECKFPDNRKHIESPVH